MRRNLVSAKQEDYECFFKQILTTFLIIIHDARLYGNRILAVGRFSYEGINAINEAELLAGLAGKYQLVRHSRQEGTVY